jgi:linoleate 10R-lipoxygenase
LYGNIERLELYVGLQAEEAKPVVEGAGLCPGTSPFARPPNLFVLMTNGIFAGYTISRAILSDAMALTRGDRFYTSDYTPYNMTAWGFADCQKQPAGAGFGSTLGRLFLRTLPNDYSANSVYTWFPLMTPPSMKIYLTKLKLMRKYDMNRPTTSTSAAVVTDYHRVAQILKDTAGFKAPYAARAALVIKGNG